MDHQKINQQISILLKTDSHKAFELIFEKYYGYLCNVVYRMIPNKSLAEDQVQEVLHDFWKKHQTLTIKSSVRAYLHKSTVNKTLNYIRDQKLKFEEEEQMYDVKSRESDIHQVLSANELQKRINEAVDALPDRCRIIFSLSRFEELTYKEIAVKLEISVKTVGNQMSKALRILKSVIKE